MRKLVLFTSIILFTLISCEKKEIVEPEPKTMNVSFNVNLGMFHDGPVTLNVGNYGPYVIDNKTLKIIRMEEGNYTVVVSGEGFINLKRSIEVCYSCFDGYLIEGGEYLGDFPRIRAIGDY